MIVPYQSMAAIAIAQAFFSLVTGYTPVAPPFKNICALSVDKIEAFIACGQDVARADGKDVIVREFDALMKRVGTLSRADVVKMACRSVGDDGTIIIAEYVDTAPASVGEGYYDHMLSECGYIG